MAHEYVVFDGDAFADERMTRDFAALADRRVFLDLDKGADLGFIADFAAVKIDELGELHIFPKLHIRRDAYMRVHERNSSRSDSWLLVLEATTGGESKARFNRRWQSAGSHSR